MGLLESHLIYLSKKWISCLLGLFLILPPQNGESISLHLLLRCCWKWHPVSDISRHRIVIVLRLPGFSIPLPLAYIMTIRNMHIRHSFWHSLTASHPTIRNHRRVAPLRRREAALRWSATEVRRSVAIGTLKHGGAAGVPSIRVRNLAANTSLVIHRIRHRYRRWRGGV